MKSTAILNSIPFPTTFEPGLNPPSFPSAKAARKPGTLAKVFSDHPPNKDRIEKSQEEIATILPARPQYLVTTSEFDEVKARLAALENRRKMVDDKDSKKPSLRRTTNTDKKGKDGGDSGDDRPTLKRRPD